MDSDFSIDENDEPISDTEQEGPKKKRRLVTKAYKEPKVQSNQLPSKEKKVRQPRQRTFIESTGECLKFKTNVELHEETSTFNVS